MSLHGCQEDSTITALLSSPRSLLACERQGYTPEQLLYRGEEEFHDAQAGREVSFLRFEHAELGRRRRLREVLNEYDMVCREDMRDGDDVRHQGLPSSLIQLSARSYEKEFEILKMKLREQIADVIREDLKKELERSSQHHHPRPSSPANDKSKGPAAGEGKSAKFKPPPLVRKQSENAARMQREREEQQKRNIQIKEERRLAALERKKHELQEENERKRTEFQLRLSSAQDALRDHQMKQEMMLDEKMKKNEVQRKKFEEERREEMEKRKHILQIRQDRVQQAISELDSREEVKISKLKQKEEEAGKRLQALRQNRGASSEQRRREAEYKEQRRQEILMRAEYDKEARKQHLIERQLQDEIQIQHQKEKKERERRLHVELERQRKQERMEAIERYRRMEEYKRKQQAERIDEETRAIQQRKSDMKRLHEFILAEKREREHLKKLMVDSVRHFAVTRVWSVPEEVSSEIDYNEIKSAIQEEFWSQRTGSHALRDQESRDVLKPAPPSTAPGHARQVFVTQEAEGSWSRGDTRDRLDHHPRLVDPREAQGRYLPPAPAPPLVQQQKQRPKSAHVSSTRVVLSNSGHPLNGIAPLAPHPDHREIEEGREREIRSFRQPAKKLRKKKRIKNGFAQTPLLPAPIMHVVESLRKIQNLELTRMIQLEEVW
uniref:Uncharacterized protein n=1 Tax=Guillardia theta TaxID=55529 RepID=A0A7S4P5G4_GUITH|mmetsp:Transcript_4368/g.15943  ORF Transcript_4368/g.15943 Transcript_4368/m.15943 type:complete len:665 (+) Transcript_4368:226-2220(+)